MRVQIQLLPVVFKSGVFVNEYGKVLTTKEKKTATTPLYVNYPKVKK